MVTTASQALTGNYRYLVEELRVSDIRDYLFDRGVLTEDEFEELEPGRRTTRQNVKKLIGILLKKPTTKWYEIFCCALDDCGYQHVARTLKEYNFENSRNASLVSLWEATKKIEKHKRQIDELRKEVKTKEEFEKRCASIRGEIVENPYRDEFVIECLEDYMATIRHGFTDPDDLSVINSKRSPSTVSELSDEQISCVCIELAKDTITFMTAEAKMPLLEPNRYAKTMRRTVEQMLKTKAAQFENFADKLSMTDAEGFGILQQVADDTFPDGRVHWGRIVAFFVFGGFVVKTAHEQEMKTIEHYTGDYIGKYVAKHFTDWIHKQGGWVREMVSPISVFACFNELKLVKKFKRKLQL